MPVKISSYGSRETKRMNALALLLLAGVASALPGRPDADPQYATPPPIEASYDAPASAHSTGSGPPPGLQDFVQ
ncbi:hypothetical protein FJT64_011671 [Amphibalanus amphitrite]|uniref:Uncharacterized protein n=1 Tax=Amphibalanus amphitrite TaxID=1232801 RepID=A0A6A4VAI2_AMPAM|nr:hypothetical protein FJT64_011671 [Amphibalanus amphitrite]